jgi:hypothetical protein
MDMAHGTHEERLAAAHATLQAAVARLTTSEDWRAMLRMAGSFHHYSPNNQLLLAAQGAYGLVASFHTWKQIPAEDGQMCRVRKGETALRVYAPIRARRQEFDEETGLPTKSAVAGYKLVPVFHQGQLLSPPDVPAQPKLLTGQDPPAELWEAIANQIYAAGFTLERRPLDGPDGPKGVTMFIERKVIVRDDLGPAQALKTEIHELGHVLMHNVETLEVGALRNRIEVEAESVAYVVCDLLGVDAGEYSIPYVASWAAGEAERVQQTAHTVLATARTILTGLEVELGVELRPNPIADAVAAGQARGAEATQPERLVMAGTPDEIVFDHLANGPLDWTRLASSLRTIDEPAQRIHDLDGNPRGQAILLAGAGVSAEANVAVMRAHGLDESEIRSHLTVYLVDSLGGFGPLYHNGEVARALNAGRPVWELADELVADLLVSTGRHPSAVRHLAETSGQPANVINLVEERLRRAGHPVIGGADRRSERGLALIEEWSGQTGPSVDVPPPEPPEPAA